MYKSTSQIFFRQILLIFFLTIKKNSNFTSKTITNEKS